MSYLTAAERAGEWLVSTAERGPDGWCWPVRPGVSAQVEPGVGWGTAGPAMFFVEAFRTTGDERWLAAAGEGRRWMAAHLGECAEAWAGCGLFTGIGGWAVVLDELAAAADDEAARRLAGRVLETVAAGALAGPRALELAAGAGAGCWARPSGRPPGSGGRWAGPMRRRAQRTSDGSRTSRTGRPASGSSWAAWPR